MPAKTQRQQRFFGALLARKEAGKQRAGDPKMSTEKVREFAKAAPTPDPKRKKYVDNYSKKLR